MDFLKKLNYCLYLYSSRKLKLGILPLVNSGRNFTGQICIHNRSGGVKRNFKLIDFYRRINLFGFIYKILKDINRTALLGAIIYENGLFSYIIISEGLKLGDKIFSGSIGSFEGKIKKGYAVPLNLINLFTVVNNIEFKPYTGSKYTRAAGTSSLLVGKKNEKIIIKFKSGWNIYISKYSLASVGHVSNMVHRFVHSRKAGVSLNLGKKSKVRGLAKNACDHPHGGGEGKKSPPVSPKSPWGWLTTGSPNTKKKYRILKKKFKIF